MVNKSKQALLTKVKHLKQLYEERLDGCDDDFYDALIAIYDEVKDMPNEVGWILPSTRMPAVKELDKECCVWATCGNGEVRKVRFNTMANQFNPAEGVIAWMPIPKPYSSMGNFLQKIFKKH